MIAQALVVAKKTEPIGGPGQRFIQGRHRQGALAVVEERHMRRRRRLAPDSTAPELRQQILQRLGDELLRVRRAGQYACGAGLKAHQTLMPYRARALVRFARETLGSTRP